MKDLYKIGEISKLYHIGPDSLRYYEKLGILTPSRGENDYRLYRINDIWKLNVIRDMRELGFSMEQIRDYLANRSVASTEKLLADELSAIHKKIKAITALQQDVENRLATLHAATSQEMGVVHQVRMPQRRCYAIHSGYETDEQMDVLIKKLLNRSPEDLYIIGNNRIGSVIPIKQVNAGNFRGYSSVFIIDEYGDELIEEGIYLTLTYRGNCQQNQDYIPLMLKEASRCHLKPVDSVLELLWVDIHQSEDPAEHITELQIWCEPSV